MTSPTLKPQFGWVFPPGARANASGGADRSQFDPGIRRTLQAISGVMDSAWVTDHFHWDQDDCLECMTTVAFYAALFPQLNWGTIVACQSYRNPAYMAKLASTIQFLSQGRLILGIGAGWKEDEYKGYGYEFPPVPVRLDQLEETVAIFRQMWSQPSGASFEGKHYHIRNAINQPVWPKPPALLIGGGGEKRTIPMAARYADWWNVTAHEPDYQRKIDILRRECDKIGRDFGQMQCSWFGGIAIGKTQADIERRTRDEFCRNQGMVGTPDHIAGRIEKYLAMGCTYFMVDTRGIPEEEELGLLVELAQRWQ